MSNPEIEAGRAIFWSGEVVPISGDYIVIDEQGRFSEEIVSLSKGEPFPDEQGQSLCYYLYEPRLNRSRRRATVNEG